MSYIHKKKNKIIKITKKTAETPFTYVFPDLLFLMLIPESFKLTNK